MDEGDCTTLFVVCSGNSGKRNDVYLALDGKEPVCCNDKWQPIPLDDGWIVQAKGSSWESYSVRDFPTLETFDAFLLLKAHGLYPQA